MTILSWMGFLRSSEQDFPNGPVYYPVYFEDQLENYPVAFVKKEVGSKLFVNGLDERTVFLDDYYGEDHDIVIANIGNDELTGLNVELINPVNIRLDDYWTIGGKCNDRLAAFDTSPNLAKIRLLPDGLPLNPLTGEIYGIPQECGEFQIKIRANYSAFEFSPFYVDFWLTVKESTNENVFLASDEGYEVMQPIV